ncbi:MAG: hypothetical protein Q9202_006190 [Teloschistes flavicans]
MADSRLEQADLERLLPSCRPHFSPSLSNKTERHYGIKTQFLFIYRFEAHLFLCDSQDYFSWVDSCSLLRIVLVLLAEALWGYKSTPKRRTAVGTRGAFQIFYKRNGSNNRLEHENRLNKAFRTAKPHLRKHVDPPRSPELRYEDKKTESRDGMGNEAVKVIGNPVILAPRVRQEAPQRKALPSPPLAAGTEMTGRKSKEYLDGAILPMLNGWSTTWERRKREHERSLKEKESADGEIRRSRTTNLNQSTIKGQLVRFLDAETIPSNYGGDNGSIYDCEDALDNGDFGSNVHRVKHPFRHITARDA